MVTTKARLTVLGVGLSLAAIAFACGGDEDSPAAARADDDAGILTPDASAVDAPAVVDAASDAPIEDGGPSTPPSVEIYAHTTSTLYRVDPIAKELTRIGDFSGGCLDVVDIAIDHDSNAFATTFSGFYKLDLKTAVCTPIATGTYPNSLSFVPKGTLDPDAEVLVGYSGPHYERIDTKTGAVSVVGSLSGGYLSSGDVVSTAGGGTFLTVVGNGCGDCLVQVDASSGDIVRNYGHLPYDSVYGVASWGGTVYGFADNHVFATDWQDGGLVTIDIPMTNMPNSGVSFFGAGSSTAVPLGPDGGGALPLGN